MADGATKAEAATRAASNAVGTAADNGAPSAMATPHGSSSTAPSADVERDLLITNASIVDVVTQGTYRGWLAIRDGRFVEVEEGDAPAPGVIHAREAVDAGGAFVQPGMLDVHMHIESSLVTPRRFAEAALPHGTTTVLQDPHEVANVLGAAGIRWMVRASRGLPMRVFSAISSCVPATSADIETPNAAITPDEVRELAREDGVLALGEMMDFQGLVAGDAHLAAMLQAAAESGLSLEGHVPSLAGVELSRYVAYGIRSDHTLMTPEKLREQLRKGLWVMVQEKSLTPEVVASIRALPDRGRVLLITDDVMPNRLLGGHLSRLVQRAVELGWDPIDAIASATVRPAAYLGLHDLGQVTPGARADFVVTEALATYPPREVFVGGVRVAERERTVVSSVPTGEVPAPAGLAQAFDGGWLRAASFGFGGNGGGADRVRARVVVVNDVNSFTTLEERDVVLQDGVPLDEDLALACVLPRAALRPGAAGHRPVVCLVAGLGVRHGAYATSFAHDSHNVFVVGREPEAMLSATRAVLAAGGGMAFAVAAHEPPLVLPLPLAGLLSDEPVPWVARRFDALEGALRAAGMRARNPVLLLTLLPLSVSPDFKVSDKGVVDVQGRRVLAPWVAA